MQIKWSKFTNWLDRISPETLHLKRANAIYWFWRNYLILKHPQLYHEIDCEGLTFKEVLEKATKMLDEIRAEKFGAYNKPLEPPDKFVSESEKVTYL